jgi:sarcosine oxidase subunit alpha
LTVVGANRLPAPAGLLLDRERTVSFSFENRRFEGYAGDCIASALAASDRWLLTRSFKYHRPRAVLSMAGQDANTLVQLPGAPNTLADREPIVADLQVFGQNYTGSLDDDREAWIGRFARFLPVGFYYKAFFKPRGVWEKWAPLIRKKAGLGVVDARARPDYFDKQYLFCDVAVVGAGPAGMEAALSAAEAGAEVILVDENPILGGSLCYARFDVDGREADAVRAELVAAVESHANIRVFTDATVNGWFSDNWLPIIKGNRLHKTRASECVLAVGSLEQPAIFHNNDLPGVMLGSAAQRLIKLYGVRPGKRAVVLTGNDDGYAVALDLLDAGVEITALVEMREAVPADAMAAAVTERGVIIYDGHTVYAALGRSGNRHVRGVDIRRIEAQGQCAGAGTVIDCDLLCMSVGYVPTYQLACHAGAKLDYDDASAGFQLRDLPAALHIAGSVSGQHALENVRADGRSAGAVAANGAGMRAEQVDQPTPDARSTNFPWPIFPHPDGKDFVDLDEDLQVADIVNATRDGYEHVQLVKRYSTVGMGPSQGRQSALATARLVADATGRSVAETGVTTARPPFAPELIAHNAGRTFYPERHTPMHHRHLEAGAQMLMAGAWIRPAYYGPEGERDKCMQEEATHVRNHVGLVDVSTLGGLDVRGPDAGEFLNRMYTYAFKKQPVGRSRYVLMTNEQGVVIDDGVACRMHEHHYYVTATTGGVDRVYLNMLRWNAQWRLDVDIGHVTNAWAGVNIAGPGARRVLEKVCQDVDLSAQGFPYMGVREGTVAGIPSRLLRVGFVGELGFEIHVPAHYGEALWDAMLTAGEALGIRPFGIEAQRLLRLEKGHIIIGQDTDAMSFPAEVHLDWAISRRKPFFVGGRTIEEVGRRPIARKLAGFVVDQPSAPIPQESHLVLDGGRMSGRVTSCYYSPALRKPIGLAYMAPHQARAGNFVTIRCEADTPVAARVVDLPFYDPQNNRQEM